MKSLCVLSLGFVVGLLAATPSSAPRVQADPFAAADIPVSCEPPPGSVGDKENERLNAEFKARLKPPPVVPHKDHKCGCYVCPGRTHDCCKACGKGGEVDCDCPGLCTKCCDDCPRHGQTDTRAGVCDTAAGYHWRPIPRHKDCHQLWLDAKILGWWDGREHGGRGAYFRLTDGVNGVESPLPWQIPAPVPYYAPQPAYAPVFGGGCRS